MGMTMFMTIFLLFYIFEISFFIYEQTFKFLGIFKLV